MSNSSDTNLREIHDMIQRITITNQKYLIADHIKQELLYHCYL